MQKRTLLRMAVAALLLTGFFVGPLQAQRFRQNYRPQYNPKPTQSAQKQSVQKTEPKTRGMGTDTAKAAASVPSNEPPKSYAILIGVNEYEQQRKLDFCAKDMEGLKDALIKGKFTTSGNIEILVTGSKDESMVPKLENVMRVLKDLTGKTKENDTVLFAFAGHGVSLPSRKGGTDYKQYLCPMDARIEVDADTGKFDTLTLLPLEEVDRMLVEVSRAKTRIMFLDACRDQDVVVKTRSLGGRTDAADVIVDLKGIAPLENAGLFRLSSCAENQRAFEDPDEKHGVFSFHLIEGLKGKADKDNNGRITLDELKNHVSLETKNHVYDKFHKARQIPTFSAVDSYGESPILAVCDRKVEPKKDEPKSEPASKEKWREPDRSRQPKVNPYMK